MSSPDDTAYPMAYAVSPGRAAPSAHGGGVVRVVRFDVEPAHGVREHALIGTLRDENGESDETRENLCVTS
ncbi:hypothetical protein GCM10009826_12430 [Humibacillus xanthopallidus]